MHELRYGELLRSIGVGMFKLCLGHVRCLDSINILCKLHIRAVRCKRQFIKLRNLYVGLLFICWSFHVHRMCCWSVRFVQFSIGVHDLPGGTVFNI